jgi:hypothetical protein
MAGAIDNVYSTAHRIGYLKGYDSGHSAGYSEGHLEGVTDGKNEAYSEVENLNYELEQTLYGTDTGGKSYYDDFHDNYEENGNKTFCIMMYAGSCWNPSNFKPKYVIKPVEGHRMFNYHNRQNGWDHELGVFPTDKFDFSNLTNASYMFQNARFSEVDVDLSNATNLEYAFNGSNGGMIRHLSVKIITKQNMNHTFTYMEHLLTFRLKEGSVIQHNGFNMQHSTKLDKESFVSIINALSEDVEGATITLSQTAVDKAFETSEGANDGRKSSEWLELIDTRYKWTIALA